MVYENVTIEVRSNDVACNTGVRIFRCSETAMEELMATYRRDRGKF